MFPPRVVLAAVDFSESSRAVLGFAARLSRQCGAELHVLHAEDPMLDAAARASGVDLSRETRAQLEEFVREAAGTLPAAHTLHVVSGPSVQVITDIAHREGADLIVVGAHGMSGTERMMFGSTTEGVLRKADTAVLVVPDAWTPPSPDSDDLRGIGPIVAAVELTPPALAAAQAAAVLARLLQTSVTAVHVVQPLPVLRRWSAHAEEALRQQTERDRAELAAALHHLMGGDVPFTLDVTTGHVPDALAAAVQPSQGRNPMLVIGRRTTHERGGAPGSTAYRVLMNARVPVLMYLEGA